MPLFLPFNIYFLNCKRLVDTFEDVGACITCKQTQAFVKVEDDAGEDANDNGNHDCNEVIVPEDTSSEGKCFQ